MTSPAGQHLVDQVHDLVIRTLALKVSPPAYARLVRDIRVLLADGFAGDVETPVRAALERMAAVWDAHPTNRRNREAAAKAILRELGQQLEAAGHALPTERVQQLGSALAAAYALGLEEVSRPLGFEVDFTLPDADAIAGLRDAGLFWIGRFYGEHWTSEILLDEVRQVMLTEGLGRVEGGRALARALGAHAARSDAYWRGLAATVATRARSFGALSGMLATGAVSYEYVNPDDERTSEVCRALDGTVFTVRGSVELRERFLAAADPEAVRAIAPWPKPGDLLRADGATKTPAELQAHGIAWPPLHFHCRSTIDVASWGPLPEATDPLGDVDLAPKVRKTRAARPRSAPGAAPKRAATPWTTAKASLDRAMAAVKSAGLDHRRIGLSEDLRDALDRHAKAVHARFLMGPMIDPDAATRRAIVGWIGDLRAGGIAEPTLADRMQRELALHDALAVAYRAAIRAAPPEWEAAERVRWGKLLLDKQIPRTWTADERALVERNWHEALSMFPVDLLRLLATEGERLQHDGKNKRAYASGAGSRPGRIVVNLGKLRVREPRPHDWQVWSHEWHHRLDGVLGNEGRSGRPWVARPGYPELPELWKKTFDAPFQAAKTGGIQPLFGETTSRYRWTGNFVDSYEARIYSPGADMPDAAFLAGDFGTGPIEFIAMAATYHAEHTHAWRTALRALSSEEFEGTTRSDKGLPPPLGGKPSVFGRLMGVSFQAARQDVRRLRTGLALYGEGWRDGMERLYGGGERFLREIADMPHLRWSGDGDVFLTAMAFRDRYGVPLERSVGPGGALSRHLSREYGAEELSLLSGLVPVGRAAREEDQRAAWEHGVDIFVGVLK